MRVTPLRGGRVGGATGEVLRMQAMTVIVSEVVRVGVGDDSKRVYSI